MKAIPFVMPLACMAFEEAGITFSDTLVKIAKFI